MVLVTAFGMIFLGLFATAAPQALSATQNVCPDGGVSDTTYQGGLLVTGDNFCSLGHVTVNGGITVDAGGVVDLENSTVTGGVKVRPGGEIEVGISLFGGDLTTSTVYGGITLDDPKDWDIETAHIYGGVRIDHYTAPSSDWRPTFCGNTVYGGMSLTDATVSLTYIGDPGEKIAGELRCRRNTIYGSLSITGSSTLAVEGNRVTGSVSLDSSTLELNGNTIGGSLLCTGGTVILPGESPDPSGNTVGGSNTC